MHERFLTFSNPEWLPVNQPGQWHVPLNTTEGRTRKG